MDNFTLIKILIKIELIDLKLLQPFFCKLWELIECPMVESIFFYRSTVIANKFADPLKK